MSDSSSAEPAPSQRRPRLRLLLRLALAGIVLATATLWIGTRSWFLVARVRPDLERRLGGEVQIEGATYDVAGRLVLHGLTLRSRQHRGDAAEVMSIGRAEVVVDPLTILQTQPVVRGVELTDLRLRLSEDQDDQGAFSFMALEPKFDARRDDAWSLPPYVTIRSGSIEVGVHEGARYTRIGQRVVRGSMAPIASDKHAFVFTLREILGEGEDPEREALEIDGQWTVETNEIRSRMYGLALDERAYAMCPTWARAWWRQLALAGHVASASMTWDGGDQLAIELDVKDVELRLPIDSAELWARYRDGRVEAAQGRPMMHVTSGTIRFDQSGVSLDELVGELRGSGPGMAAVPYQVTLRMDLDWDQPEDWGEEALAQTPFRMTVRLEQFAPKREEDGSAAAVELPLAVVRFFERFRITDWALSTELEIERVKGTDAIGSRGQVYIHNATGAYEKFPYPLQQVEAYVHFDREEATIEYLNGRGAEGAAVHISGRITPPGPGAGIALRLTANDVPLDEQFRAALGPRPTAVFETLVHEPSAAALRDAGLLVDESAIEEAARQRDELLGRLSRLREDGTPEELERLRRRLRQLDRVADGGPFVTGGIVDLDLQIDRERGAGHKTIITGRVDVESAGLIYRGFPYPVRIIDGSLLWQRDRVTIVTDDATPGLRVVTPGGGTGVITGQIGLRPSDGRAAQPTQLDVAVRDDRFNPLLIAAIPPQRDAADPDRALSWNGAARSDTGALLQSATIEGDLHYGGRIELTPGGEFNFAVDVDFFDGSARPDSTLLSGLGLEHGQWPPEWRYEAVDAKIAISEETIVLHELSGRQQVESGPAAEIRAQGWIALNGPDRDRSFVVSGLGAELSDSLVDLLPEPLRDDAGAIWDRYRPAGHVDAQIRYQTLDPDQPRLELEVVPSLVELSFDGQPVRVTGAGGRLRLMPDGLRFDGLSLAAGSDAGSYGQLTLEGSGAWGEGRETTLDLGGRWLGARVDCPVTRSLLQRLGTSTVGGVELEAGTFDAEFAYRRAGAELPADYAVTLRPHRLQVRRGETRLDGVFDEGSEVELEPTRITLRDVSGRAGDSAFRLDGTIDHVGHVDADLQLHFEGSVAGPLAAVALPAGVTEVLEDLALQDPGGSRVDGRLRFTSLAEAGDAANESRWRSLFEGQVETRGVRLTAGLDFEEVGGLFEIRAAREPGRPVQLVVETDAAWARTLGHPLDAVGARVRLAADGRSVLVEGLHGTLHGGAFSGDARFDLHGEQAYQLNVNLIEVPLNPLILAREPDDGDAAAAEADERGEVFAGFTLSGQRGDPATRRGRGSLRIVDGQVAGIPLLLQIVQVTQLTLPVSGVLDYADVAFFISGDRLTFERILFESTVGNNAQLQLIGEGEMDLATFELDTRFRSRSGLLVVRDLAGGIGDQLWIIEVKGPLKDPEASLVPLPALTSPSRSRARPPRPGVPVSLRGGGEP